MRMALLFIPILLILFIVPITAEAKTYYIHEIEMPKHWEKDFGDVLPEAIQYWEKRIPGTHFVEISNREKSDFVIQWASQYQDDVLGYWTPYSDNSFGKPYIAITLGYMDDESVKWQDRKFNLVESEYVKLITIHELGHAIGLDHSNNPNDIMYFAIYDYDDWLQANSDELTEKEIWKEFAKGFDETDELAEEEMEKEFAKGFDEEKNENKPYNKFESDRYCFENFGMEYKSNSKGECYKPISDGGNPGVIIFWIIVVIIIVTIIVIKKRR